MPLHDRGKVLVQSMLVLAGGGECCDDIEHLRSQDHPFGAVPSDSTTYRTFRQITPDTLAGLWEAMAATRAQVWRRWRATTGTATVVLDIDASLVQVHSENKEATAPNYKGGFGFHPMLCFADATGEALSALLRPGNAGANSIADHLVVLDAAITQPPPEIAIGHDPGDDAELVARALQVRIDSAGCSKVFAQACRERNVGFALVARSNRAIHTAISGIEEDESRVPADPRPGHADQLSPAHARHGTEHENRRYIGNDLDGGVEEERELLDLRRHPFRRQLGTGGQLELRHSLRRVSPRLRAHRKKGM